MRSPLLSTRTSAALVFALFLLGLDGCSGGVRQDQSIHWTADGGQIGFSHHEEGIQIADKDGQKLHKIFQPGPDVLVTSSPIWSPIGRKLIFTTAKDPDWPLNRPSPLYQPNPAGELFRQRNVTYTCWFWEESREGPAQPPLALFNVPCDHPGYVAANLAVRWHPQGNQIYYIQEVATGQNSLFAYDLRSRQTRKIFPHTAEAILFDWTPAGSDLCCVITNRRTHVQESGIWIGNPELNNWWHVPQSQIFGEVKQSSPLEVIRAAKPAWSSDGSRFAFATFLPGKMSEEPARAALWLGSPENQNVTNWAEGSAPFRDLHWSPNGRTLGFVMGRTKSSLHTLEAPGRLSPPINQQPVQTFAGWNASGTQLAYTVSERFELNDNKSWALLLNPIPHARDRILIAPGNGENSGRQVFSGMRVTFPRWSAQEDKLSAWFTFTPTHRSLFSLLTDWGLPAGDPGVVFEPQTGKIHWLAANAREKAQIGHYHLLKRSFAEAWRWYQEAEADLPEPPAPPEQLVAFLFAGGDFSLFEYLCLERLGRAQEAREKLAQFERSFARVNPGAMMANPSPETPLNPQPKSQMEKEIHSFFIDMIRDFYAAEVFLSLDAPEEARLFLRQSLDRATTPAATLSTAIVLSQVLLLERDHRDYANLVCEMILPALETFLARKGNPAENAADLLAREWGFAQWVLEPALLPMFAPDFLAALSDEQVRELIRCWQKNRNEKADESRLLADLFLSAAYQRLGQINAHQEVEARIQTNPAKAIWLLKSVAERIDEMRKLPGQIAILRELLGGR